jgi:uncharacterized protein YbaA (DUF1428 family)
MSKYADVYLCPVPEENIPAYKKLAIADGKLFIKHGALRYREYVASESHRNKIMNAIMADPELAAMMEGKNPPFDYKRMVYGGFKLLVDL